ncbi:MAG: SUMF1/EgtB/PvdO family nonheme iron enzyme [SAR324 cluster bacterium]|nr:SUMF1/EgtB/PvdO family nonheme iron enzyme [SAR324 cluster bacterium]
MKTLIVIYSFILVMSVGADRLNGQALENMVLIPAGKFQMGHLSQSASLTKEKSPYFLKQFKPMPESPVHSVFLNAYYFDIHEVSNGDFQKFVQASPQWNIVNARGKAGKADQNYLRHWNPENRPDFAGKAFPVIYVSWFAAEAYCKFLNKRLPTEAEWERAARAGSSHNRSKSLKSLQRSAWFYFNSLQSPHPVKSKAPNIWGIYHLQGNVWEWVQDWYSADYYNISPKQNPPGPASGTGKVIRGGGWNDGPNRLSVTSRDYAKPLYSVNDVGFRCALSYSKKERNR